MPKKMGSVEDAKQFAKRLSAVIKRSAGRGFAEDKAEAADDSGAPRIKWKNVKKALRRRRSQQAAGRIPDKTVKSGNRHRAERKLARIMRGAKVRAK